MHCTSFIVVAAALAGHITAYAIPDELPVAQNETGVALTKRQSTRVVVCNGKNSEKCGTGSHCTTVTLNVGTWASVPGTKCWYIPGSPPYEFPDTQPHIKFCNRKAGRGKCTTADACDILTDHSCSAPGTESMSIA